MDEKANIVKKIQNFVKEQTINEETGHDWWHINRVYNNALLINRGEEANELIISIIALFHDLYDYKIFKGNQREKMLETFKELQIYDKLSKDELENILYSCENMSYSKNIENKVKLSKEGNIVQDADRLDSIGAIGIARTFAYGGKVKRPIYNPELKRAKIKTEQEYKEQKGDSLGHFYDKMLKLKNLLNTETAKKVALNRHVYMEKFLEEFYKEWNGEL